MQKLSNTSTYRAVDTLDLHQSNFMKPIKGRNRTTRKTQFGSHPIDGYYWEQVVQREVLRHLEDAVRSYYTVIVHVGDAGNAVITHNPTIHGDFERSDFALPVQTSDTSIDGDTQREITLYPTASENMLSHFVRGGALAVVEVV